MSALGGENAVGCGRLETAVNGPSVRAVWARAGQAAVGSPPPESGLPRGRGAGRVPKGSTMKPRARSTSVCVRFIADLRFAPRSSSNGFLRVDHGAMGSGRLTLRSPVRGSAAGWSSSRVAGARRWSIGRESIVLPDILTLITAGPTPGSRRCGQGVVPCRISEVARSISRRSSRRRSAASCRRRSSALRGCHGGTSTGRPSGPTATIVK